MPDSNAEEARGDWGGPRKGAGGKRPGAGRPRKPRLGKTYAEECYVLQTNGRHTGLYIRGNGRSEVNSPTQRRKLITTGHLANKTEAFVYVGLSSSGIVKIGMSSNPLARCDSLGITLMFCVPVVVSSAKLVETYALQSLGALVGDGEWVENAVEQAVDAVCQAWMDASRVAHVNPLITADEARMERVRMASL